MTYDDATRRLSRFLQARAVTASTSSAASVSQEAQRGIDAALATAVPLTRTITIDGVTHDLSADRTWTTSGGGSGLTIEEADGSPSVSATKLILPNGTLGVVGTEATYTPAGGGGGNVSTGGAAVTIPGLLASPDRAGYGGAGTSREFEAGDPAPTWNSAPASEDVGTTYPSHLYFTLGGTGEKLGTYAWAPVGALDARTRISLGNTAANAASPTGLIITNSDNSARALVLIGIGVSPITYLVRSYTYSGGAYTQRGSTYTLASQNYSHLRITRDGSNNFSFWFSADGLAWALIATQSLTMTVAKLGFRVDAAANSYALIDYLRTSV